MSNFNIDILHSIKGFGEISLDTVVTLFRAWEPPYSNNEAFCRKLAQFVVHWRTLDSTEKLKLAEQITEENPPYGIGEMSPNVLKGLLERVSTSIVNTFGDDAQLIEQRLVEIALRNSGNLEES